MDKKEKTFCILPFVHLYAQPDGEVKPCCIAGGFENKQSLREKSIEEIYNSDDFKQLRSDMMNGVRNKICDVCYKKEDSGESSPRNNFNSNEIWEMPEVNEDYSVPLQFQHIDIRFSNLCNFKCRMCNHNFSSNWFEDANKLDDEGRYLYKSPENTKVLKVSQTIVEDLIPYLGSVKSFYFAGGEPLIMPEHFKVLNYLYDTLPIKEFIDRNENMIQARDLSIHYNTNLSVIKYDEQSLIDLWKGFKRIYLSISCDGIGKVGEYQRTGFSTKKFEENMKIIQQFAKPAPVWNQDMGIIYGFQYTTTSLNIHHIFDFIDYMLDMEYVNSSEEIDFYYAWGPEWISIHNMDEEQKKKTSELFEKKLITIDSEKTKQELTSLYNFMNTPNTMKSSRVNKMIQKLDKVNNTDYNFIIE
jgi:MoaA/NifB/PqqE/SkfB family radical SAM enzyme